ncbi:MAG: hypothetical protein QOI17_1032, partial [Gaiellales bacterium]|nr:hypothetical protein [Gaiellales bacterium]
ATGRSFEDEPEDEPEDDTADDQIEEVPA